MVNNLRADALHLLEANILPFWSTRMVDNERGGFYGRIDGHNTLHPDAPKGAVLNARILWTFASACRVLHRMPYRILAARAKDYLMQRFIDHEYGGVFWSLHADGTPLDTKKQTYAISFAIYGLAEYHRATGDQEALDTAISLFHDIETHAFSSPVTGNPSSVTHGYIEALTRDWQPIADMRLSDKDENGTFTMNTHLHVLEAYTNLYRVWRDPLLEHQLRNLIVIFTNRIYNPETGHLNLFFDEEWKIINHKFEIINHKFEIINHKYSPGHDIEAAWLLHEALDVLGDNELLNCTLPVIRSLAQAAEDGILRESEWWCYAEAVVGYIDQWQLLAQDPATQTESEINLQLAQAAYEFIRTRLIDRKHGEWYWSVRPDGTPDTGHDKAGFWKCPYHNSRMCYELIERLNN